MSKKIAVIGSGIGGLASALRLSTNGYDVTVYESSGDVGGKIAELNQMATDLIRDHHFSLYQI